MRNDLIENFDIQEDKIHVIPNPVDLHRIKGAAALEPDLLNRGRINIVAVGRLTHHKGFDLLLRAFKMALDKVPDLFLTILGGGGEENSLKGLAGELGVEDSVRFKGNRDNPFPYISQARIFVASSRYEGLPNAVLESLACGTPVLAFDCPGGTAEIIEEGRNGWLVPSEDVTAMKDRLIEIVRGEKWSDLERGNLLPERFHLDPVVRRYEEALLNLCDT
jgi:glycosyltransferase involved in cell wall biosynthesis